MIDYITIYVDGIPHIKAKFEDMPEPAEVAMALSKHYAGCYITLAYPNGYAGYRNGVRTRLYLYGN